MNKTDKRCSSAPKEPPHRISHPSTSIPQLQHCNFYTATPIPQFPHCDSHGATLTLHLLICAMKALQPGHVGQKYCCRPLFFSNFFSDFFDELYLNKKILIKKKLSLKMILVNTTTWKFILERLQDLQARIRKKRSKEERKGRKKSRRRKA